MNRGRFPGEVAPEKPASESAPPTDISIFFPAAWAARTAASALDGVIPFPSPENVPSGLTMSAKWMICVTAA